jgi:hypothetical protein
MQVLYSTDNPSSSARLCRVQVGARLGQFETRKTVEEAIRMEATVFTGRGGLSCLVVAEVGMGRALASTATLSWDRPPFDVGGQDEGAHCLAQTIAHCRSTGLK